MSSEIIYLRGSTSARGDLIHDLDAGGYEVSISRDFQGVVDRIARGATPALVIIDAATNEGETSNRFLELRDTEALYQIPIVFLGVRATSKKDQAVSNFRYFYAFDMPAQLRQAIEQISAVCPSKTKVLASQMAAGEQADEEEEYESESGYVSDLFITTQIVENPSDLSRPLMADCEDISDFDDREIVPRDTKYKDKLQVLLDKVTCKSEELGLQARRTSMVASAVCDVFALDPDRLNAVRRSALLISSGFLLATRNARCDLLAPTEDEVKVSIDGVLNAARVAEDEVGDERAARVLRAVAEFIENGSSEETTDIREEAECVLISEMVSRSCWTSGSWDKFGAYRLAKHLRKGRLNLSSSSAARGVMRLVIRTKFADASDPSPVFMSDVVIAETKDAEAKYPAGSIRRVALHQIERGMRTARPIVCHDGRMVVPAGVVFDNDLCWKLWDLALVRPVFLPIFICK